MKDLGTFEVEPKYPFLWDRCVYELLYNPTEFVNTFCEILKQYGINEKSDILDTCAGSGFPALDMFATGYTNIVCVDGSNDQVEFFSVKAEDKGLAIRSRKVSFKELANNFQPNSFDLLICKGTVWYAGGGWNEDFVPDKDLTMKSLRETMATFYSLLRKGGVLYVDKFKDSEVDHKDTVGSFSIGDAKKELIFWASRDREAKIRRAKMIIKDVTTGEEHGIPNVTYDLSEPELESLMIEAGFKVTKPEFDQEKFFTYWFAVKQ